MIPAFGIVELAKALHPRASRWRAMALLNAYFDESGTHAGSAVTAIAGCVALEDAWADLEPKWAAELGIYADLGVRSFHMTDALAQQDQFARVSTPHIKGIITQLSTLLGQANVDCIFSAVANDDWYAAVTDPQFLARFPTPFDLCFEDIVRALWEWSQRFADGEVVVPMFAYHPEYHDRMAAIGRAYGAQEWYREVLGPISFGYPAQVIPLQGADLVVHQMNDEIERRLNQIISGRTMALDRAAGGRFIHGHWFDVEGLEITVKRFHEIGEIYRLRRAPPDAQLAS